MEQNRPTAPHIPVLTGLRVVAAYLVFLHHYNPAPVGTFANRLFHQGYTGVSVFFVLSGFLIYYRYADDYLGRINWSWRRYLQSRFARIFPLYILLFLVTVAIRARMGHPLRLPFAVLHLTLLNGFSRTYAFNGIPQSWSLTVELCFYLAAPFFFAALKRWRFLPLTAILINFGLLIWWISGNTEFRQGIERELPFLLFYTFFGRSFEFILGMRLARRWQRQEVPNVPYTLECGLLIVSCCILWQTGVPLLTANPTLLTGSEVVAYNFILPIGISLLFMGLLRSTSCVRRVLSHAMVQSLGRSSYAFYLIHVGVVAHGLQRAGINNRCLLFGLLVLIAHGLYVFIERPLHRWLRTRERQVIH